MALKPGTAAHLARAERNRAIARALCDAQQTAIVQPPPVEWATVVAFYAAVHYVNALLWERLGQSPRDHPTRRGFVARTTSLRRVLRAYDMLADLGWHARYTAIYQPSAATVRDAVHVQLEGIRTAVHQALGVAPP
jgi:hypothetical protein